MTNDARAGASRPGRRLVLKSASLMAVALLLFTIARGIAGGDRNGWDVGDAAFERTDAEIAAHLLRSVHGANDVVCAAVDRAFNGGWGSSMIAGVDASVSAEADETARWLGKNDLDRSVLDIARPALASADACTRRVAARLVGNVDVKRLDDELLEELQSSSSPTRFAAVLAIGYAEQDSALPTLEKMLDDRERTIRLAALWGIGALENEATVPMLVRLLERDPDAEIRRMAAWALGQLD